MCRRDGGGREGRGSYTDHFERIQKIEGREKAQVTVFQKSSDFSTSTMWIMLTAAPALSSSDSFLTATAHIMRKYSILQSGTRKTLLTTPRRKTKRQRHTKSIVGSALNALSAARVSFFYHELINKLCAVSCAFIYENMW